VSRFRVTVKVSNISSAVCIEARLAHFQSIVQDSGLYLCLSLSDRITGLGVDAPNDPLPHPRRRSLPFATSSCRTPPYTDPGRLRARRFASLEAFANIFGKRQDGVCEDVRGETEDGVAVDDRVLKVDASGAVLAHDDAKTLIVPSVHARAALHRQEQNQNVWRSRCWNIDIEG
jgi:hypothetical protein